MKINICMLVAVIFLTGCTTLSEKNPKHYEESLKKAQTIIKSNKGVGKYEKYYNSHFHKAFAQSKVNGAGGYSTNKTSKEFAIEAALELCHQRLLKKYDEITDRVSCEIVNVDNEWVTK